MTFLRLEIKKQGQYRVWQVESLRCCESRHAIAFHALSFYLYSFYFLSSRSSFPFISPFFTCSLLRTLPSTSWESVTPEYNQFSGGFRNWRPVCGICAWLERPMRHGGTIVFYFAFVVEEKSGFSNYDVTSVSVFFTCSSTFSRSKLADVSCLPISGWCICLAINCSTNFQFWPGLP